VSSHYPRQLPLLCLLLLAMPAIADERPVQKVLISFDGALHNEQWQRSRELADETGARFTYFLSCTYLLTWGTRGEYHPPDRGAGGSNVGFGFSREDVAARLEHIWLADREGHEIANHACGHFDGAAWSKADWLHEFSEFDRILAGAYEINEIEGEPEGWRDWAGTANGGFRAPYLSVGDGLFEALKAHGFAYDASAVSRGPAPPRRENGITHFALPMIPEGPEGRPIIAMDYNLFVRHSGGFDRADVDGLFEERAFRAFLDAFEAEYSGERLPLQIGLHFTLMNGGAYWNALERFVRKACAMEDVACVSYREAMKTSAVSELRTGTID
jgi:peptidoglycan/xylan/chitin deacetylase (PgdA/CDA1 family)